MRPSQESVWNLYAICQTSLGKVMVTVEGVHQGHQFDEEAIEENHERILAQLLLMPREFLATEDKGSGGFTLLDAGKGWANDDATVEQLVALGMAARYVEFQYPREIWATLPGGKPCVTIFKTRRPKRPVAK